MSILSLAILGLSLFALFIVVRLADARRCRGAGRRDWLGRSRGDDGDATPFYLGAGGEGAATDNDGDGGCDGGGGDGGDGGCDGGGGDGGGGDGD
jgi:hypothetical protein